MHINWTHFYQNYELYELRIIRSFDRNVLINVINVHVRFLCRLLDHCYNSISRIDDMHGKMRFWKGSRCSLVCNLYHFQDMWTLVWYHSLGVISQTLWCIKVCFIWILHSIVLRISCKFYHTTPPALCLCRYSTMPVVPISRSEQFRIKDLKAGHQW